MSKTAREAVDVHMSAINQMDSQAMIASQNFPFVHIWPDGKTEFVETQEDFTPVDKDSILGTEWHHTTLESATEITQSSNSVSFHITVSRRREDESILGTYAAIWIATNAGTGWAIQFRHGAVAI